MLMDALAGGLLGGRLIRVLPGALVRIVVIAAGAVMTIIYTHRYWI